LVCGDDVNLFGESMNTVKENKEVLLEVGSVIGLQVNTEKTKHIVMSRHQNVEKNHNLLIANHLKM